MASGGERRWLWVILGVALALRLGWGMTRGTSDAEIGALPDQGEYLALGRNLLHTGVLSFWDARFGQEVFAYRTPGYPAFVALCGGSVRGIRAAQAVIDTSVVWAVYLMGRRWGKGGIVAAGLVAVNPLLIYFSGLVLSETLYTALLAWGVYFVMRSRGWWVGVALLVLGAMVRPAGMGLVVVLPVVGLGVSGGWRARAVAVRLIVAAGLFALLFGGWAWRNHRVLGAWVWLTTNEGITRYDGFNPRADGSSDQWFVKAMPRLADMDEVQRDEVLSELAAQYMNENPGRVGELAVRKIARTWSPVPLSGQFGSAKYMIVGAGYTGPFFLLVLLGLIRGKMSRSGKMVLLVPALYFTAVHAMSVGSLRYRVPVEPELAIIAGAGVAIFLKRDDGTTAGTT